MRSLVLAGPILVLSGCVFGWETNVEVRECATYRMFADADQDLWGDPADEGEVLCETDPAATGLVRNNRDCDDGDPAVTARTGSICPPQLVLRSPAAPTDFAPVTIGTSEFLVVHAPTGPVWAAAAEDACGPIGWGGRLATFASAGDLEAVLGNSALTDTFAAYVGFRPDPGAGWGHRDPDAAGGWVDDPTGFTVGDTRFCSPRATYGEELLYLAVIRDRNPDDGDHSVNWCLGTPDEALPSTPASGDPAYAPRYGHFICERPVPVPADWALAAVVE